MRFSTLLVPTLREVPADADIPSHRLMLRAGLMRRAAGGIYSLLPLGHRVRQKIEAIIREHLDREGCQELTLPIIQPAELWHATGRWDDYGDEMFKLKDRHGRSLCLGPTHEEIITDLVAKEVRSYKQLPLILYQIQNKYRDEIRPRFGVMRGREFIMKDAYSFDLDEKGLKQSYAKMYRAYDRLFQAMGIKTVAVEAFAGEIGGDHNHEFVLPTDHGEDEVVLCSSCGYAANIELAGGEGEVESASPSDGVEDVPEMAVVDTPAVRTIAELETFLQRPATDMIKTLLYKAEGEPVVALVRGDRDLNEAKMAVALGVPKVEPAEQEEALQWVGAPVGFLGPVGLENIKIIADPEVTAIKDGVTGANENDQHLKHVVYGRDYKAHAVVHLRMMTGDDPCPACGGAVEIKRGIELGHIFQLGTKYTKSLGATYLDRDGKERPIVMGCYGIGVTRTIAAIIEQHHDEKGIVWPVPVAPYHACIVVIDPDDAAQADAAQALYDALWDAGVETVIDDRHERPGVKFNDAELIGFPYRLTVGARSLVEGHVELRHRGSGEDERIPVDEAARYVAKLLLQSSSEQRGQGVGELT